MLKIIDNDLSDLAEIAVFAELGGFLNLVVCNSAISAKTAKSVNADIPSYSLLIPLLFI